MKTLKTIKNLSLLVVVTLVSFSCSNDDDDNNQMVEPQEMNIVETAQSVDDLSILVEAVIQAGLVDALTAAGDKTVLAPTNAAFVAFLATTPYATLADVPNDVLTQILLNHVIDGTNILSSSLAGINGYTNTLADGPDGTKLSIYFDGTSGVTFNGGASVAIPDVSTSNGIVHVIDQVIGLPTIATFATSNPALSTLVAALAYADSGTPTVPYIDTVSDSEAGPFTVFAPTNDAFGDVLAELSLTGFGEGAGELNAATTDAVLLTHIVGANVQSSGLPNGAVTTLGGNITADNTAFTLTDPSNRVSNIITTLVDIQSTNGVVHVIDKVILPGS